MKLLGKHYGIDTLYFDTKKDQLVDLPHEKWLCFAIVNSDFDVSEGAYVDRFIRAAINKKINARTIITTIQLTSPFLSILNRLHSTYA